MTVVDQKLIIAFFGEDFSNKDMTNILSLWCDWAAELASTMSAPFTHIEAVFRKKPKQLKEHTPYLISKYLTRIKYQIYENNISEISLYTIDVDYKYIAYDWKLTSSCGSSSHFGSLFLFGIDSKIFLNIQKLLGVGFLYKFYSIAQQYMNINYGFATIMPRKSFPLGYAIGIMSSSAERELVYDATAWRRSARRDCRNVLRNMFGWSILSPNHLSLKIGTDDLAGWINQSPNHGRLIDAGKSHFFWTFQDLSEGLDFLKWNFDPIRILRKEMQKYHIFAWQHLVAS
jgi:hypothetical protein